MQIQADHLPNQQKKVETQHKAQETQPTATTGKEALINALSKVRPSDYLTPQYLKKAVFSPSTFVIAAVILFAPASIVSLPVAAGIASASALGIAGLWFLNQKSD